MARKTPSRAALANPDAHRMGRRQLAIGGALVLLGAGSFLLGSWSIGSIYVVGGAVVLGLALYVRGSGETAAVVNRSLDAIERGRLADAERLLGQAEKSTRLGYLHRAVDLQRALIAFRRGAIAEALLRADAAVARPIGILMRAQERMQAANARALRALLRASSGDEAGAREDVAWVRASGDVSPETVARAELALAVVLERGGDREALRRHLDGSRSLLLGHTAPRERAVVRAYQRMLQARRGSVYRESAPREPEPAAGDEPSVADWMATVVPGAAPFARRRAADPAASAAPSPLPTDSAAPDARRAAQSRLAPKPARKIGKLLALYVLLIGMFLGIWQFLAPSAAPSSPVPAPEPPTAPDVALVPLLLGSIVVGVGLVAGIRAYAHMRAQKLLAALVAIARGDVDRGEAMLRVHTKSRFPLIAGRALQELAHLAERRGAFAEALGACDRAIAVLSQNPGARAVASASLLPELVTERAFILAATDRDAEAAAEMAVLAETYPAHPHRARSELRVDLVRRVRRGDLEGAATLVAQGTDDIPLSLRDECLADLCRAVAHPASAGAGELDRLRQELRADAGLRAWLEAVAPGVLAAFSALGHGPEPAREAEAVREAEAAREAEAEGEAEVEPRRAARS